MFAVYRELEGSAYLLAHAIRRIGVLRLPPVKFAKTIREALGRDPERPGELLDLERLPQRYQLIEPDAEAVKRYIAAHS